MPYSSYYEFINGKVGLISCPIDFVGFTGNLTCAILLWYLMEQSDLSYDLDGWFYKSYPEIERDRTLSYSQVNYYTKHLEKMGILTIDVSKNPADDRFTRRYKINTEHLLKSLEQYLSGK